MILQSARNTKNNETRLHLTNAHSRVMSFAALQNHLAQSQLDAVELPAYFTKLCSFLAASMIHDPEQISIAIEADEHLCSPDLYRHRQCKFESLHPPPGRLVTLATGAQPNGLQGLLNQTGAKLADMAQWSLRPSPE